MKQIVLTQKNYQTIKYFYPEPAPTIERPCDKCGVTCTGYLSDLEYPADTEKIWFCCEPCDDHEFYIPIKCVDVSVVCTFEVDDDVRIVEDE